MGPAGRKRDPSPGEKKKCRRGAYLIPKSFPDTGGGKGEIWFRLQESWRRLLEKG